MKSKSRILIPTLLPALLAIFVGLTDGTVRADSTISVPAIHLTNLAPAAGKYINIFFVQATEALLVINTDPQNESCTGQQLKFNEIMMAPIRKLIPASGLVDLDVTNVPKHFADGLTKTYTHIFVAITEAQPNPLYLRNRNGAQTPIIDPRLSQDQIAKLPDAAFQIVSSGFISKFSLPARTQNGVITLDTLKDLCQ